MTTAEPLPLPERLRFLHGKWAAGGRQPQPGSRWSRSAWHTALPDHGALFETLPDRIDRESVRQHFAHVREAPDEAVQAFIVAMIWGYGPVGYGAFRTARVLAENRDVGERLKVVAQRVWEDGGCAGFEWLKQHRISWLGVAFATKYLYFCSIGSSAEPALVLDSRVQRWLARHAGWRPRLDWSVCDYSRYLRSVVAWGRALNASPCDVEYLIFRDQADESVPGTGPDDETGLLEAIQQLSDTFAEVSDGWPAEDADDFQHALRQLGASRCSGEPILERRGPMNEVGMQTFRREVR